MATQDISKEHLSTSNGVISPAVTQDWKEKEGKEMEEDGKAVCGEGNDEGMEVDNKEKSEEEEKEKAKKEEEEEKEAPFQRKACGSNTEKDKRTDHKRRSYSRQPGRRKTRQGRETLGLTK